MNRIFICYLRGCYTDDTWPRLDEEAKHHVLHMQGAIQPSFHARPPDRMYLRFTNALFDCFFMVKRTESLCCYTIGSLAFMPTPKPSPCMMPSIYTSPCSTNPLEFGTEFNI